MTTLTQNNINSKNLSMLTLTLTDPREDFSSFCPPVFCDFVLNYSCTVDGAIGTSLYFTSIVLFLDRYVLSSKIDENFDCQLKFMSAIMFTLHG